MKNTPFQSQTHFVGAGNMASALIGGLLNRGFSPERISVSDPNEHARDQLQKKHGITAYSSNLEGLGCADMVVLAVKPQHMQSVITELADVLQGSANPPVLLSIAAGITTGSIKKWARCNVPVIRSMPNTPALIGQGASGLYATPNVSVQQKQLAENILSAVGKAWWLPQEDLLDAVTAVSGSGPAYFFLFMEALQQAGEAIGLPKEISRQLVLQTAQGAAGLALHSPHDLTELRRQVTSPGGTTAAALEAMLAAELPAIVRRAVKAAHDRAGELSREFG